MAYRGHRADRAKALALVLALHAGFGLLLLTGRSQLDDRDPQDRLASFDVPVPPPEPQPPPIPDVAAAAKEDSGTPARRASPALVVAPEPVVPLPPSPLPTSERTGLEEGRDPRPGAADVPGSGAGAGGDGDGLGGGGSGGSGTGLGTEARLLSGNLNRRDYRRIRAFGSPRGQAILGITVGPDGHVADCQALASSGSADLDDELCRLLRRTRWSPALDRSGRPVSVSLRYVATWDRD